MDPAEAPAPVARVIPPERNPVTAPLEEEEPPVETRMPPLPAEFPPDIPTSGAVERKRPPETPRAEAPEERLRAPPWVEGASEKPPVMNTAPPTPPLLPPPAR